MLDLIEAIVESDLYALVGALGGQPLRLPVARRAFSACGRGDVRQAVQGLQTRFLLDVVDCPGSPRGKGRDGALSMHQQVVLHAREVGVRRKGSLTALLAHIARLYRLFAQQLDHVATPDRLKICRQMTPEKELPFPTFTRESANGVFLAYSDEFPPVIEAAL